MGRKATGYLIHLIVIGLTFLVAILALAARFAAVINPNHDGVFAMIALAMIPLLLVNVGLLLFWAVKLKAWVVVPVVALAVNFGFITSIFQVSLHESEATADLKVATYNVHEFEKINSKVCTENIAEFLREESVDVVCFQEFRAWSKYDLDSVRTVLSFLPYNVVSRVDGVGLAIFSRYPILNAAKINFPDTENSAMWADVAVNGLKIRVFNNHLQTTNLNQSKHEIAQLKTGMLEAPEKQALHTIVGRLKDNFDKRADQVLAVRSVVDSTLHPLIICGDFNDTPASFTYHQMKQELQDGFKTSGSGYAYTIQGFRKLLRIDYIFFDATMQGVKYQSPDLPWSDHNPVLMELSFVAQK